MRVLCVTSSYPRHEQDIAGCFVKAWRDALTPYDVDIKVLCWQVDMNASCVPCMVGSHLEEVRYAPAAWQKLFHGSGAPENIAREPWLLGLVPGAMMAMAWRMVCEVRAQRPDLIVGHWVVPSGVLVKVLSALCGVPCVVVTHSGGIALLERLPEAIAAPWARWLGESVTCVSEHAKARFESIGGTSLAAILPMGFQPPTCEVDSDASDVLVLGRTVPIKGGEDVIRAYAQTSMAKRGVMLHLVGDGDSRRRWVRVAHELGVVICAHGTLTGARRDQVMARCRIALCGSRQLDGGRQEGLPISVLECAAMGVVPMVAHMPAVTPWLENEHMQQLSACRRPERWALQIEALYESDRLDEFRVRQRRKVRGLSWEVLGREWYAYLSGARQKKGQ